MEGAAARRWLRFPHPLGHAQQVRNEAGGFIKRAGAFIAGKYGERQEFAAVLLRPSVRMLEQRATDAVAFMSGCHRDVRNVAGAFAGKEIALDLQVQEADRTAIRADGDEEVVLGRLLTQSVFEVGAKGGHDVALAPAPGQVEGDETRDQREDEVLVFRRGGPYIPGGFSGCRHGA